MGIEIVSLRRICVLNISWLDGRYDISAVKLGNLMKAFSFKSGTLIFPIVLHTQNSSTAQPKWLALLVDDNPGIGGQV